MATPRPPKVVLSERERADLERLVRAFTTGQQLALRARIVLAAGDGLNNLQIARELGLDDETPGFWRQRWLQFRDVPLDDLSVAERLADAPREGAPAKFTPEQVCQIIALTDEMTRVQALERAAPGLPLRPGKVERREFEYIRHGTLSFMINFYVVTGKVICPSVGPTRNEVDFLAHIRCTVESDPSVSQWHV